MDTNVDLANPTPKTLRRLALEAAEQLASRASLLYADADKLVDVDATKAAKIARSIQNHLRPLVMIDDFMTPIYRTEHAASVVAGETVLDSNGDWVPKQKRKKTALR